MLLNETISELINKFIDSELRNKYPEGTTFSVNVIDTSVMIVPKNYELQTEFKALILTGLVFTENNLLK